VAIIAPPMRSAPFSSEIGAGEPGRPRRIEVESKGKENACGLLPLTFAKNRHGMSIKLIVPWTLRTATLPGDFKTGNGRKSQRPEHGCKDPGSLGLVTVFSELTRKRRNAMILRLGWPEGAFCLLSEKTNAVTLCGLSLDVLRLDVF
jgi:hypothetical protein